MPDFGTLTISEVILHRVPAGRRDEDGPDQIEYSEATIELGTRDRDFIQLRLRTTLGGMARPVVEDPEEASTSPDLIRGLLAGSGDIVGDSAQLAQGLHRKQKWMSSVGLVMVIRGTLEKEGCLIIAKMEHEEGMRVQQTTVNGKRTYRAEYLRDLILGEGTQVFKVGVFTASGAKAGETLAGHVVDVQQGGGGVAEYFVEFLGCRFVQRSDVQTEAFFKTTQSFIARATKGDPEATAEYEIALLSELQNRSTRLSPEQFALRHLRPEHRDDYLARITASGLPVKGFTKDNGLITSSIRRVKFQTGRGATVLVPPPMYEDGSVAVEDVEGEETSTITITDKISSVTGASGPKRAETSE
ncbi:nucleoid-associated protein [Nocardioides halotolerans]|uniref:nucleoid-associated protein n=1 Tax=Nocardioides halotolerans TaxID=433660 RepID=UPI0004217B62|nr:nucleoid-associated protein [Nocardioides halotolerans]